uniref:Peptidyl-prolyl isomerase n=1 Tax=uncultured marine thaumarchaeote KM3_70_E10 TaxID=1456254 RepID=A0A075HNM0_9ARCH|nr:hypothetical protein [uncultured marine thaumarchaeote KM3_70_E10]
MKIIFALVLVSLITIPTVSAIPIADKTGLKFSFPVTVDGSYFVVDGTANFDVKHMDYDVEDREITFKIYSSLDYNLVEMIIPKNLLKGDDPIFMITSIPTSITQAAESSSITSSVIPKIIHHDSKNLFVTLEFNGIGTHYLTISESSHESVQMTDNSDDEIKEDIDESTDGGCLIATAAYGSELAPQVQFLREIRDGKIMATESGTAFMTGFNQFYYSFSPVVADYERENPMFKEAVKVTLTPLLTSLAILNYVDIDTEQEMLGYGIGVILLNIGMYFVAPAVLIMSVKKRLFLRK